MSCPSSSPSTDQADNTVGFHVYTPKSKDNETDSEKVASSVYLKLTLTLTPIPTPSEPLPALALAAPRTAIENGVEPPPLTRALTEALSE